MNKKIEQEIKKYILPKLFSAIKFNPKKKVFLSGDDNLILSVRRKNKNVIIRITPESYKTYDETLSELDIIEYLLSKGIPISKPLFLIENKKTLRFNYKERFYTVSLFQKAKGKEINPGDREPNVFDSKRDKNVSKIFFRFGKYTAMMHNSLSIYKPAIKNFTRPGVSQYLERKYEVIEEEKHILEIYKNCLKKVYSLPRTKKNFGLVHFDLHCLNFHVYKNDLIFFDFTDTRYAFFMWDIAKVLFSNIPFDLHAKENLMLFRKKYESFLRGYKTKRVLTSKDIDLIKLFLKMTELRVYFSVSSYFRKKFNKHDMWGLAFLKNRKEYLENNFTVFEAMKRYLRS